MLRDEYLLPMLTTLSLSATSQAYASVVHHYTMNAIQGRSSPTTYPRQCFTLFLASSLYDFRKSAPNYDGCTLKGQAPKKYNNLGIKRGKC